VYASRQAAVHVQAGNNQRCIQEKHQPPVFKDDDLSTSGKRLRYKCDDDVG